MLGNERICFDVIAETSLRVLCLDEQFFAQMIDEEIIKGLDECISSAQKIVNHYGVPYCDYRIFKQKNSCKKRFINAVKRCMVMNKAAGKVKSSNKFIKLIQ